MPIFKINETDLVEPIKFFELRQSILSIVLFPRDDRARNQYRASEVVGLGHEAARIAGPEANITVTLPQGMFVTDPDILSASALRPAARRPEKAERLEISAPGLAGSILLQAFLLDDRGTSDVSLTKSIEAQIDLMRSKARITLGSTVPNLTAVWNQYRPVAHISAAMVSLYLRNKDSSWFNDQIQFVDFLRLANSMRVRGQALRHKKAAEPILHRDEGYEFSIVPCAILRRTTGSNILEPGRKI